MTNPQNPEPRLDRLETDMTGVKAAIAETARNISELRSAVAMLADLVTIQQQQAEADRVETNRRFEESRQQADRDRALMLQLIQSIAQGGNGGSES